MLSLFHKVLKSVHQKIIDMYHLVEESYITNGCELHLILHPCKQCAHRHPRREASLFMTMDCMSNLGSVCTIFPILMKVFFTSL